MHEVNRRKRSLCFLHEKDNIPQRQICLTYVKTNKLQIAVTFFFKSVLKDKCNEKKKLSPTTSILFVFK